MPFSAKIINDTEIPAVTHLHWYFLLLFFLYSLLVGNSILAVGEIYTCGR